MTATLPASPADFGSALETGETAARARLPLHKLENALSIAVLALITLLPLAEVFSRRLLGHGITGSGVLVQHLTLCIGYLGAGLAARSDNMLGLSTTAYLHGPAKSAARVFTSAVGATVTVALAASSMTLVRELRNGGVELAWGLRIWMPLVVMPALYAVLTLRLVWHASEHWPGRFLVAGAVALALACAALDALGLVPDSLRLSGLAGAMLIVLGVAAALGLPMYAAIGGIAAVLFWRNGVPLAAVAVESYDLAASPLFPSIPLFTLAGYVLSAGHSSQRLVRAFNAWFGWMHGGPAIVTTLVFAFFTSFTGASGVTILSLGGLLAPVLMRHHSERFAIGLVTTAGCIGLLFPPSLPVILLASYAERPVGDLFLGGLLPGALLVLTLAAFAVFQSRKQAAPPVPFDWPEARASLWAAKWELLAPVVVLGSVLGGFATMVEAAAITVLYAAIVEMVIFRDVRITRELPTALLSCATIVGGVMIIMGVAMGFTNFMVDAEIPAQAVTWVRAHIESRWQFLLALNVLLLVVGAAMDIFSAIMVVVPLILPMADAYGIDRVHLGILFLANLNLGYLVPPMGENLFLASYRFGKSLPELFRAVLPFVLVLFAAALVISYVPALTLWFR